MIDTIRNIITLLAFCGVAIALVLYTINREFGWIFRAGNKSAAKPQRLVALPVRKPFQGSAQIYLK